ncbi:MAG: hypothetical protein R2805_02335 [Flavobacterium sp.]|uniref:hypothetical protein n=1 Tax=Flavobacterium sp. TaxID=239 RepID=UPI00352734D5
MEKLKKIRKTNKMILLFIVFLFNLLTYAQKEILVQYSFKYIDTEFGRIKIQRTSNWYEREKIKAVDSTLLECVLKVEAYLTERSLKKKSDNEIETLFNDLNRRAKANNVFFDLANYKNEYLYYKKQEERKAQSEAQKISNKLLEQKKFDSIIDSKVREQEIRDSLEYAKQKIINDAIAKERQKQVAKTQTLAIKNEAKRKADRKLENTKKDNERRKSIIEKYGVVNGEAILKHIVKIGWTKEMCIASWGKPKDINRTTNRYIVFEQYVYSLKKYLYFENGILTSIQD